MHHTEDGNEGDTWLHRHLWLLAGGWKAPASHAEIESKVSKLNDDIDAPLHATDQPALAWARQPATPPRCWVCRDSSALGSAGLSLQFAILNMDSDLYTFTRIAAS
jgi:hypothetical protein